MRNIFKSMRPLVIFSLIFIACSFGQAAEQSPIEKLTAQNYLTLSGRVYKLLEFRFQSMNQCSPNEKSTLLSTFRRLPKYSSQQEVVVATLALYLQSYKVSANCKASLDLGERKFFQLERAKFKPIRKTLNTICPLVPGTSPAMPTRDCRRDVYDYLADLEPHCVSVQVPNPGDNDPFPCMVGDYLTGQSLVSDSNWRQFLIRSRNFLDAFNTAVHEGRSRHLDLYAVYKDTNADSPELREEFLALINFFLSSHRSNSAYIRGFHDHIWAFVLFKTGNPEVALNYFVSSRLIVDEFRGVYNAAEKRKFVMSMSTTPMAGKIRHDYMAAYLACHYRDKSAVINKRLPILLGVAYEALDFKSHIVDQHVSVKASVKNFKVDTRRYREGVVWGKAFCSGK